MIDARPTRPGPAASNRRAAEPDFEHGLRRASDPRTTKRQASPGLTAHRPVEEPARDSASDAPAEAAPLRRPNGLPMLLLVALALVTAAGIVQVRARARVLELGAEIADMTGTHSGLLDQRRRLEAERAYLRHPDYIHSVAASRLQMVPAAPERIQTIRLQPDPKTLANQSGPKGQVQKPSPGAAP
ncbi:MAG: cell division protein FtsL [Nannocystis sp.]|nr:cell division protein FtsL [Nannocystis sp.]MBA3546646.1 cell division protein FtsL [Nannocystis sp.]